MAGYDNVDDRLRQILPSGVVIVGSYARGMAEGALLYDDIDIFPLSSRAESLTLQLLSTFKIGHDYRTSKFSMFDGLKLEVFHCAQFDWSLARYMKTVDFTANAVSYNLSKVEYWHPNAKYDIENKLLEIIKINQGKGAERLMKMVERGYVPNYSPGNAESRADFIKRLNL